MTVYLNTLVVTVAHKTDNTLSHDVLLDLTPSQEEAVNRAVEDLGGEVKPPVVRPSTFFRVERKRKPKAKSDS